MIPTIYIILSIDSYGFAIFKEIVPIKKYKIKLKDTIIFSLCFLIFSLIVRIPLIKIGANDAN